ncbi:MAG: hypothetical protein DCC58_05640 [Chloroflexi bacterium]|nr:MAG: hypothetical protein DCC58_05640 [Chloroflexota bacterium]
MSFMRTVMENAVRNMSPDERHDAIVAVATEVARTMTAEERASALVALIRILGEGLPASTRASAFRAAFAPPNSEGQRHE